MALLNSVFILAFIFASGCATKDPSHLIFYEDLSFGFNAKGSVEPGSLDASFGYDRETTTIIPKSRVLASKGSKGTNPQCVDSKTESKNGATAKGKTVCPKAMSVISKGLFDISWLGGTQIKLHFATGEAAQNLARVPGGIDALDGKQKK